MKKQHLINKEAIDLLGTNVRKYRLKADITQRGLAEMCGVEFSQIGRLERGKINTSVSMIYQIGKALNIEPYLLLKE